MVDGLGPCRKGPDLAWRSMRLAAARHPFKQEILHTPHAVLADGTVVDW